MRRRSLFLFLWLLADKGGDVGFNKSVVKNGLYVLTNTDMPAVLVELAFISNEDDEKLLRNNQDDFARAIARGVTDYL